MSYYHSIKLIYRAAPLMRRGEPEFLEPLASGYVAVAVPIKVATVPNGIFHYDAPNYTSTMLHGTAIIGLISNSIVLQQLLVDMGNESSALVKLRRGSKDKQHPMIMEYDERSVTPLYKKNIKSPRSVSHSRCSTNDMRKLSPPKWKADTDTLSTKSLATANQRAQLTTNDSSDSFLAPPTPDRRRSRSLCAAQMIQDAQVRVTPELWAWPKCYAPPPSLQTYNSVTQPAPADWAMQFVAVVRQSWGMKFKMDTGKRSLAAAAQKIQDDAARTGAAAPMTNGGRKMSTGLVPSLNRLRIQQCFKAARPTIGDAILKRAASNRADMRTFMSRLNEQQVEHMGKQFYSLIAESVEKIDRPELVQQHARAFGESYAALCQLGFRPDFFAALADAAIAECVKLDGGTHKRCETLLAWSQLIGAIFTSVRDGYYSRVRYQRRSSLPQNTISKQLSMDFSKSVDQEAYIH
ncbi:hypothetical protein ANCCEY_00570 [Ancylostoma ceylanicum]|uniref:Globin domain-containing protein n=1 Tax=Ancylostoma ceylanicum TaxID=53326 RepID=A0A0D6M9Y7_9BILA|nr:hypothetical protein ANCCEY_00570 [Ancylostoma ceylanicum]